MTFPALGQTLDEAFRNVRSIAAGLKPLCTRLRTQSAAGALSAVEVLGLLSASSYALTQFNIASALPGMGGYAQAQIGNADIAAEFSAMVAAVTAMRDWIFANFPKDAGSGAWLSVTYDIAGSPAYLTFSTVQLAPLRALMGSVEATIG